MQWVCGICGFIHDDEEPPDFCPDCGAPGNHFSEWTDDDEDLIRDDEYDDDDNKNDDVDNDDDDDDVIDDDDDDIDEVDEIDEESIYDGYAEEFDDLEDN
jgi:hypothetical protein